jgi:hypothetical protein
MMSGAPVSGGITMRGPTTPTRCTRGRGGMLLDAYASDPAGGGEP